ncbi:leucine-rich repeat transmembrane protein CCDC168 [Peromyscus californicus insignis]|uniref:leucine-rich repeat transmembrane protein CCDC168 n=1 Tax=Peromyscus californicus insignis TaxID=564181 RepID=UPI0022A75328|nr:leucine-rich repeat transmembrane protein CCDC168 [Peromyscus californicus insignis]
MDRAAFRVWGASKINAFCMRYQAIMSKIYHFFKKKLKSILDENTFGTIWDFLDSWIFNNAWIPILFLIFLGVAFEIILVRTCEFFKKKLELWENGSSSSQKNEDVFPKGMTFAIESWSISQTSSAERVETFSGRITTSSPSEENGDNTSERTFSPYECEYQGSHFCESHSSSGGTSTSLSMFYSEVNKIFMRSFHRKDPQSEYQTIQFSSNKLFPIMKTNKTKNKFPDALSFQSTFKFTKDKDLNVTPCPPVHLFLSSDQIRHVEENVRRKIPVNPKAISAREADCLHPSYQESYIHYQHSSKVVIPAEAQDTFSDQSAMQNQMIHEAQFTNQTQSFIYNQEPVSSQPDFVQPLYFMRLPFSNSLQDSFQAQQIDHKDKSQHFIHIPCIAEAEDSTKGIESDEHFSETQYSVYLNDQNKSNHLVKGQNSVFQNAEFLSLSSNSFVEPMPQQKVTPGQEPVASLESNQFYAYSIISLSPTIKRRKNRRKIPDNERKLSLKVPSPKAKKISCSRVFPIIVCHTSENKTELRCKKKKIAHQRKVMSDRALHLISVSKLINLHVKKYFFKNLVAVIPDLIKCEHFLKGQNKSLDTEKINYASSPDRVSSGIIENIEHSFIVNTHEMAAPCSLFETNTESKESSEDSVQQSFDLNIPKHEGLSEVSSESAQKDVSFPHIESYKGMKVQKDIQSTENVEELTVSTPNVRRCFSKDGVQNAKNSVEITLNFLGTNLLISLGPEKHVKNELKDINVQVITGSKNLKEEKPLTANITEYSNPNDSEKMECGTRSNKKNRHHDERMSDTSHNTMQATISELFDMEICNKLKANAGTPTINCSHTALKQEKLLDEKKIQEVKHADKSPIVRKPRKWDCEEEEKHREVSVCLKQKDKCAQFEMEQIHLGNRKNQRKEKEVQSQTISTQTVWETSPCPLTNPLQVEEVKQRTDKPIDREEAAGPMHSPLIPENLPVGEYLSETTKCRVPLCGNPTKTLDGHIIEDKEDLKKDLCSVATGPLKVRKKTSGPKNVRGVKHKIIKVKKPEFSLRLSITARDILHHRRKVGNSFENITKQMLHDVTLAPGLLNVHPQRFIIHNNKTNIKITPPKTQVEKKEENLDSLNKESEAVDTLEVHLHYGVKVVEQMLPETVAHVKKSFRFDAHPAKEIKMEKEMFQAISFTEAIRESVDSPRMDSFCVANTKNSTSTQTELQYYAELELGLPTTGKLWMGESLSQSRESNVPNSGNDTREINCGFTQKAFSWSLNYCMPPLTHSKKKKERTRFTNTSTVRLKYTNKVKPPASKTFNITGNKKKSKLDLKTKLKRINQKKAFLHECQNTLCLSIHRRLQGVFCHALLKQRGLPNKICVDCVVESSAFYKRKKKLQEEKQNPFVQAAPQHGQHQWADADQRKDTLPDEPDPSPVSLSQEQLANSQSIKFQKDSLQSALETNPQMAPIQAKVLQKATKTENDINFPVVPKILSPESGNSSPGEFTNMTDDDLESDNNSEHELDLYPAEKDSETSSLQVTFLQSSDSVTRSFVSKPKEKRKALRSKKQVTVSQKCRAMREIKPSVSQTGNFRYSKKLKRHKEMKDPQQTDNIAGACLDIVHYKVYILPNKKIINSKPWADKQRRIRRLGRMQRMQEKSPNGRNACCPGSADLNSSSSMKKYEEEGEEELEHFLISENSPSLIFDIYQEKDHGLVRSDKQLNQLGRTITQVQPQTPTEVISCSTLCPMPDELQLEKLEGCFSVSPLKFREAKDNALSERESDLSDERRYKEQAADSEKEAKELSASYTNQNLIREIKCDSTKMKGMYQEKKFADETSSLTNVALDINMSSKIETEKGTPSKKTPCSIQKKPKILLHEGRVTSDDIKEIDLQDKEEKKNDNDTLLKSFSQYSQHFVICSHQSRDPNSHKLRKQRGRNILFIVEQDIPQQSQSADLTQREPAMCTSSSKIPPIQSGELQIDKVKTDRTKYDIPDNGTLTQKLNSWNRLEREGLQNDLQATITESLNLSTPDVPRSKRKSKVSTCKALQGKMCSTGITMKGRKTSVSKLLTIPQCGHRNNLLPKTLKSQIFELLIHSGVLPDSLNIIILKDPTAEGKKGLLTQELAATMLESLGFSIPTSKERENLKLMDKGNEMSKNSLTVKTRKAAISQTLITAECRTPKQGKPMAGSSLHAIFSPMPVSLNTCDGIKDRDTMWTMRFSHEFHDQSVHKERAWCTHYLDKDTTSNGTKDVKGQSGEEGLLTSQHFRFSAQNMTGPNSVQSGLQLINSATYPELERALYYGQAQTVNVNNLQSSMVGVMSPFLNTEESEIGSIPCDNTWDENPRGKCDYPISEQKAWTQKDLTSLEPLQEPSLVSFEYKCESCTLEFAGKRDMNPKARQASRLLNTARHFTRVHRKKKHHNSKHWLRKVECVEEVLLYAIEDAKSCPLKFITDKLSLDTAARAAFSNRIPQRSMAEEKAKLQENLATTFLGPYNFLKPLLSDFKSQVNTAKLSENEILLNKRFSTMKKMKLSISKIIKINGYSITNHKKKSKLRAKMKAIWIGEIINDVLQNTIHFILTNSNRKDAFKAEVGLGVSNFTHTQPTHGKSPVEGTAKYNDSVDRKNNSMHVSLKDALSNMDKPHNCPEVSEPTSNTTKHGVEKTGKSFLKEKSSFYLTGIITSIARHLVASKEFKKQIGNMRVPDLPAHKGIPSQMKESTDLLSPHDGDHAAVNISETQDLRTLEIKVDNGEINIDTKSVYMCTPIQHIKTESSHSIWDMYEESAKRNCLDKPKVKRKEECGQLPFGTDQKRQPDPLTSEVLSTNTVHCKDSMLQKTAIYQEGNAKVGEEFGQEVILPSKTHTLQIERQNNEFKTGWKTKSKSFALQKKQEKPSILGPTWSSYACDTTYPETIRQKGKAKTSNVKSSVCAKQIKLKAKKIPVPLLLGHGDRSNKKELRHSMQHQSTLELRRNVQNLILKGNFDLGCFISPVKKLTSIKLEKGKLEERKNILPQIILEKPSSQRQMSWSGCVDVSRKLEENIKEVHDHCTFKDIHQQFIQQFRVKSEEIKEHHSYKLENLQRKMNSELTSQKDETDNFGLATLRSRGGTKVYTDPQDNLQQEYPLKQGMWRPGIILQPMKGFPHFGMTNEFITKQDIKPSSPQRIGGLKVMDNSLDPKESLLVPRLAIQKQNPFTDPLLESIPSHVPHQLHTEELKENMKISGKTLKTSTKQPKKVSNTEYISDMDHIPRSIEKLLLLIKEQEKRRKKSREGKKIEIVEDIKTATKNTIPFLNYSPPGTQFVNTIKNSGVFKQREETEPNRSVATLWRQQRLCVQGISLDYVYTDELTSKVICQNRRTAFMESIMYHKRIKMKVRKTTSGKQLNITGYRAHSYRKELRHSIKIQKELPQGKTVADLLWKGFCASGYITSQIKKLMEVKEEKGEPQRPYILPQLKLKETLNETKMLSVQPIDNSSISSTIRKSTQYTIKQKEHQVVLLAITPQNKDQLMTGQQVEEPRHINFSAHLEKEAYHVMFPETGETNYSRLEAQRPRSGTEFEFSTAQRVKQGAMKDSSKHALLVPPRGGGPKRINISSSRGHDISLMELDIFQKKTGNVQELLKQENTSRVGLEPVACPVRESFHLENTKVTKEVGMYYNIKNISHLFGLRKTDPELGFKAQAFLCTDLEDLHKTGTAQKGHAKSGHRPRIILNSVPCHKRAPLHLKPSLSTARKDHGDSAIVAKMNPKGKEKAKSAKSPLKLNRQKVNISKNLRAKQLIIFTQTKEKLLEILLSCILYLQAKNTQKQISAKASLNSNIFNPMVEKGSSEFKILEDQSPSSERVNLHTKGGTDHQESVCEALPMSNIHCLMNIHRITTPQIKKALKSLANLDYHALNIEKGEQNNMIKEQNQYHLSFSLENLEEHISCSQNYSHVQQYLEFHTKEALSKVGNVSNRTKGLDLSSKDQLSTVCECRPEWIFPSVILEQTKEEDTVLPLESGTIKCSSLLSSERKQLSDGVQISKSVSNDSSTTPRCSKKELSDRASEKKQEVSLPKLFLHCFSLCMQFLNEHEKQKSNTEYRVMKDIICPERKALNLKTLVPPHISSTEYIVSNKVELQCYKKEKMVCIKHGEDKPGSVVIKACEPIPLPHFKLDKENIDMLISSNVRQEKHKSQEEKNGIKGVEIKEIIDSNITLKTENSSLSYPSSRKKLTLLFDTTEQQGKVQEGLSKSDMKLTKSFISLPPLLHPNLNSKIKVGKDKSRLLESCLPPLKPLLSLKGRKVPFSKTFSTDNLCKLIELKYLPQKKEYRNSIPDLKNIIGLICIAQKRKKLPFKCLLRRKEQWWNNKTRKIIQGNKNNLDVVQNKPWDSVPSSPYLKWDPEITEAYLQGIMKFCLGSPALSELSSTVGQYQEPTDSISSSTEKAKHIPLKHRLHIAPKEGRHFRGPSLRQELFSASQELQFNVEEKAKKMQEDKQIKNWNKPSIYSLPYSEVVTRINGEEAMQITRFSTHHPKLQRPSDIEEIIYAKSNFKPSLNSVKHATKYAFQKEEESTKPKKTMQLKEKPPVSQTIQLVITEPGQEIQKIKDELNVVETSTSTWMPSPYEETNVNENLEHVQERKCKLGTSASFPHSKLDIEIKAKEETWIETRSFSLHSQSMESSDAGKLNYIASSLIDISDSKRSRYMSYKEENGVNAFERSMMHPKTKHVNINKSPLSYIPKIKRLKVNLEKQIKKKQESRKEKVMLPRETHSVITSSDASKLDQAEEVETDVMQSHVPYPMPQESLPVRQVASTKAIASHARKRKLHLPWEEEEVQTSAIDDLTHPNDPIFKTEKTAPYLVSSVNEHSTLSKKKTHGWSSNKKTGQKQERARHPNVVVTKSGASVSLPVGQVAPAKQIAECAKKRKQYQAQEEVKTSAIDGLTHSSGLVLKVSAPPHVLSVSENSIPRKRKTPWRSSKEKIGQKQEKNRESNVFATKNDTSSDTRVSEEEDVLGETQISFLPPKIQDVSDSEERACMESTGYVLNNRKEPTQEEKKKRLRKDVTDKKIPKPMDKKGKKLPRSHTLNIKEFQRKIQEEKLVNTIVKFSISQLQLEKFSGAQMTDREVYNEIKLLKEHVPGKEKHMGINSVMHAKDIYLKTKKSPALPMQNLSNLQWKTREQGGKVEEEGRKPGVTLTKKLTKTLTAMSHQPILTTNTGIKEECTPMLTRSSVSMGYLQKSSDSEGGIYIQQITGGISISLQNEKQHMSEGKEEAGMQIAKIVTTHNYQETKVQGLEDEQGLVLTKAFPLLPDLPHPKLHEKIEFNDTKLRNSTLQRLPTKGETVPREAIVGNTMKDVKKEHTPQREDTYRKEIIDRRGTDITLKSRKSLLSQKLHRTELQMHINASKSKGQNNESEPRVLRKIYTSKPSPTVILCKGVKLDEEHLESKLSSPLQQMFPALSDTEEMADKDAMCDHVRKEKQYTKQIEKTVDLTTGVHCKRTKVLPISHLLNTKELVLNMKVLEKKVHKDKSELAVVATRSFLSMPSLPCRYSQDKTQRGTARVTAHSYPQGNFQEPADAQETATRESAEATEHNMLQKQARPQKSVTSAHRIGEHPQVESECESVSPDHKIDLTRLGTIKREKMLNMFFKGQKGQPEKCEKESTEIGNWKKENEIKDNLRHKTSSKFPVSPLKKSLREALITNNTLLAKGSETEREQETGSGKSDKPKKDRQSNATISNMLTPEKTSLEKPRIAHLNESQNKEDQNVNMKKQTTLQSKSGQQIKPKSFPLLNVPVHSKSQRMPSQTDVDEKTAVTVSPQIQLRVHMSTAEFNATRSKEDPPSIVLEQEQCDLALPQKSRDSLLKSEHLEERDEMNIISDVKLKQKNLEIDSNCTVNQRERKLKTDRSRGIDLEEVNREMQKTCSVNLENKARENTSSTTNYALPIGTEESEVKTGVVTPRENNYPSQKKLKKELELSTAKQNLQGLQLLQTNVLDSLCPSIPVCPKSQKSRFTVTNLKRELKPKYLTLRIPKHPISKILGIRCGSPSSRRKLEYAFNKPKTMIPSSKDVSGIIIRSLCVSMISPPHIEGTVESTTNPRREKRVCRTKFQEKLPDARDIKDILTIMRECFLLSKQGEAAPGTVHTALQDKNNKNKTLVERLFPIYETLKSIFEAPLENKIQNQVLPDKLGEVGAYKPDDAKASPLPDSPDTSSKVSTILLRRPLLKQFTPELKNKLSMHLVSKATEIKLNQLPEMVNISLQKYNSRPQRATSEDYKCRLYLKHKKMKFRSPKAGTIKVNLKNNYRRVFPPLSCVTAPITNVSSSSKVMTEAKGIKKQESVTSLETRSNLPLSNILHKFSEKENDDLLVHFCTKTLEIQTIGLPRIVVQSYAMANAQDKSKRLFKCIHSTTNRPQQTNRVLVLFDKKSFCEINRDLQYKYLYSIPRPSVPVVSKPKVLPKHTSKLSMGLGSVCKTVEDSEKSNTFSFDKDLLQHISFQKKNPQEISLLTRKFQEPNKVPAFYPGLQGTEHNDMIVLSDLKLQMTPEKGNQCHVWFQESNSYKHSVSGTQQNTVDLADSHSSLSSDGWNNDFPFNISTDLAEYPAHEETDSEECVFIETNFYLTQGSQKFQFEIPKGIPLADVPKVDEATLLKPYYREDPNDHHTITLRKHTSPVPQPCHQSRNSRKHRSDSKMQSPDWLFHGLSNTVEIESTSSSITLNKEKHWTTTTWSRTSYSLTSSTTESHIKLNLAKKHSKSHMYPQVKERRKTKSDLWRKSNMDQSSNYSHSHNEEKHLRKKRLYHYKSKESNPQTNQMPESNAHWQNIKFYSERKENQPFFYACIPADSMEVIPQTIRWVIPPKILQKRNFQVPRVANISKSWNLCSSSKKLLGSLTGAFNTVHYG